MMGAVTAAVGGCGAEAAVCGWAFVRWQWWRFLSVGQLAGIEAVQCMTEWGH